MVPTWKCDTCNDIIKTIKRIIGAYYVVDINLFIYLSA